MNDKLLGILRAVSVIAVIIFVIIWEATCDVHGSGHLHIQDVFSSLNHWVIHLSACILVCETVHAFWHSH